MKAKLSTELAGFFRLVKHDQDGNEVYDSGWFGNLILDQGITALLNDTGNYPTYRWLKVGSGNAPPTPSDTQITQVASAESTTNNRYWTRGYVASEGYHFRRGSVQYGMGAAAGNLSEVAAGWDNSANSIFSRALILDALGNPATITVLENEFLTVEYELRSWYIPPAPHLMEYDDDGTLATTTVTYPAATSNSTGAPGNGTFSMGTGPAVSYDRSRTDQGVLGVNLLYPISQGNPSIPRIPANSNAPANALLPHGGSAESYVVFDPPIPKTNEFTLAFDFDISFSRR